MKPRKSFQALAAEYMGLAFLLPSSALVGYAIGYLLDRWLGTRFLYLVCLLLGIAGGMIELIRKIQKDMNSDA